MKNKNLVTLTSFVLLLTLVSVSLVSNTFAKYTTKFSGSDSAVVANWDVSDGDALASFDIFGVSKIYDTKDADYENGVVDTDVTAASGAANAIIAPGTWGSFAFTLSNTSDVNAVYSITYDVDEAGVFLQWSTDGNTWTDDLANVTNKAINKGITDEEIKIYWKWAYEGETGSAQTDEEDTKLGTAATLAQPSIGVEVIFTQVD